ncbi:short transient receptor potential channel 4-like [Neodiprion virginianus]|uniref:short transient receptor potential channel 4-like n=1 Tax=Neodiprion virginianus TaxID=2961670 RepID=UPI001EE6F378|nr:short transient receptor potential channel 4-like [Neodiprion virginianus]
MHHHYNVIAASSLHYSTAGFQVLPRVHVRRRNACSRLCIRQSGLRLHRTKCNSDTRPSVLLPQLQESEKQFFDIVNSGSVAEVRNFLAGNECFNINCVNFQGFSALHIAIHSKNLPMLEYLLSLPNIDIGDTALHAVRINEERMVVMILDRMQTVASSLEFAGTTHSSDFLDETTPLAVAAHYGHYEIIRLLLDRGHFLNRPHRPSCYCDEVCKPQRASEDTLTMDKMRLFLYTAVANPSYICLTSEDPILIAFELAVELKEAAEYDRVFYIPYQQLSHVSYTFINHCLPIETVRVYGSSVRVHLQVTEYLPRNFYRLRNEVVTFATELIGCARTTEEIEMILKQSAGLSLSTKFVYPRLVLAMDFKIKPFVAHPNVQQLMETRWQDDWYEWRLRSIPLKVLSIAPRIVMLPVIVFWTLLAPNSPRAMHWSIPVNKFLSFAASYTVFLFFVYVVSNIDKTNQLRGPPDSGFEVILVIYVMAYIWGALRLCMIHGPKRYFRTPWNWYEVIMLVLFALTFLFWGAAMLDVQQNGQRDLERKYWNQYDPTLIAEGTYCIATIMAFFKLLFVCQLDHVLGPLQMSLVKMINDVTKFIAIFTIIIFSFTAGLVRLYQYYEGMVQVDDVTKLKTQQVNSFVNFSATLKTLFWAIFCMSPIESADIVIENLPGEAESKTIINDHKFTQAVGYVAFALFEFISVIVVLNMLIACMSNTFTKITDNVSVEWMFGRTEVYIDFMTQTSLPAPFNLIPTASAFNGIAEFIKAWIKPTPEKKARWNLKHCCYVESLLEDTSEDFSIIMSQLVQRYFRKKDTEIGEAAVEPIQKELVELRSLLREALSPA